MNTLLCVAILYTNVVGVTVIGTQQSQVAGTSKKPTNVVTRSRSTKEDEIVETRVISSASRGGRKKSCARGGRAKNSVRGGSSAMHGRVTRSGIQHRPAISAPPVAVHDPSERASTQEQGRQRPPRPVVPPRMPSQRIMNQKLSAPLTGPGSTADNEIIID